LIYTSIKLVTVEDTYLTHEKLYKLLLQQAKY
jgi:hypothetical protein